jgi:hypothetical protein
MARVVQRVRRPVERNVYERKTGKTDIASFLIGRGKLSH